MQGRRLPCLTRTVAAFASAALLSGCSLAWKHPDNGFLARLKDWDERNEISTAQMHAFTTARPPVPKDSAATDSVATVDPVFAEPVDLSTRTGATIGMAAGVIGIAGVIAVGERARAPLFKSCMLQRGYRPDD